VLRQSFKIHLTEADFYGKNIVLAARIAAG
jgi:hypothetical protein